MATNQLMSIEKAFEGSDAAPFIDWFKARHPEATISEVRLSGFHLIISGLDRSHDGGWVAFELSLRLLPNYSESPQAPS